MKKLQKENFYIVAGREKYIDAYMYLRMIFVV